MELKESDEAQSSSKDQSEGPATTSKMHVLSRKLSEVVDIMKANVTKIMTREENLEDLAKKAERLKTDAQMFDDRSQLILRKENRKKLKTQLTLLGVAGFIIILVTLLILLI